MVLSAVQRAELVERMLSPEVQVQVPVSVEEVEAKLTSEQVAEVFTRHVPGVHNFLFRQQPGQHALRFMQSAYQDGFRAFKGTALEQHLKWLFRLIVHYGHEGKSDASQSLKEVAEAFMDCQAVQARVVERVGLQIRGVTANFHGLVTALLGEYKTVALKMLAVERIMQGKAHDDATPTHYENRLTADIGGLIGLNADDVRRAGLDEHAHARFAKLPADQAHLAAARCRELFDLDAFLQAFVSEVNSFSEQSSNNSLPRLFLDWVAQNLSEKHVVFDEDTCTHVDIDRTLAMAILEVLFRGRLVGMADEECRATKLRDIFHDSLMLPISETAQKDLMSEAQVAPCSDEDSCAVVNSTPNLRESSQMGPSFRKRSMKKLMRHCKARRHDWEDCLYSTIPVFEGHPLQEAADLLRYAGNASLPSIQNLPSMAASAAIVRKSKANRRRLNLK